MSDLRAIAFYLPQFHPIAENDAWWGRGFTEWSNVTAAKPLFLGHHQPQLPTDLGFYDLRLAEARAAQAKLAREYGIHGFCYYRYWFSGRPLLERPFEDMLKSGIPDFPFCVCWANENWTRRWDGLEDDVLLAQHHSVENDLAFLSDLMPALKDPRYIRVDGRPLVLIYRTHLMADPLETAKGWRELAVREGLPGLYLVRVESLHDSGDLDPEAIGFDAAVEFPPNSLPPSANIARLLPRLDPAFVGHVCDYETESLAYMARMEPAYRRFSGVMPSWDNTARSGLRAVIRANARPDLFQAWLDHAASRTRAHFTGDQRLIFINAWNEWAEGCHLEPDSRFGRGFLDAARAVLIGGATKTVQLEIPLGEAQAAYDAAEVRARELEAALMRREHEFEAASRALDEARALGAQAQMRADHLESEVAARDRAIIERDTRVAERDARIVDRDARIAERDARVAERDNEIAQRDAELGELRQRAVEAERRKPKVAALESALNAALLRASTAEAAADHRASVIAALHASTSWRVTRPLRVIGRTLQHTRDFFIARTHTDAATLLPRTDTDFAATGAVQWFEGTAFPAPITTHWLEIALTGAAGRLEVVLGTIELFGCNGELPLEIEADLVPGGPPLLICITKPIQRARYAFTTSASPNDPIDFVMTLREPAPIALSWRAGQMLARHPIAALRAIARDGLKPTLGQALLGHRPMAALDMKYQRWIEAFDTLRTSDLIAIKAHIARMVSKPVISVVVPVYNTDEAYLGAMIASVRSQIYPHWELCLADDASSKPQIRGVLEQAAREDSRIKLLFRSVNGHIAAASNSALDLATGDFVALLDHDDVIPAHALYMIAAAIEAEPDVDILYSDEDKVDAKGKRFEPYFKPDFNRELVLGQNFVSHLGVYRAALLKEIGGFRTGFEGSQDYDLMLRAVKATSRPIVHLPWILYHWRLFPGADTFSST